MNCKKSENISSHRINVTLAFKINRTNLESSSENFELSHFFSEMNDNIRQKDKFICMRIICLGETGLSVNVCWKYYQRYPAMQEVNIKETADNYISFINNL